MTRAFVFPGQGSQVVGMGAALAEAFPAAREVLEEVDEALQRNLSRLMREGPAETLVLTENAQPALMAASLAVIRVLEREAGLDLGSAAFVAGHSLGEYSALCAARALSLAETARLLKLRGTAMQVAVPVGEGAMAALIGADHETGEAIIAAALAEISKTPGAPVCTVANDNGPQQVVISGSRAAVEAAVALAPAHGAKRAVLLDVSAPFHCPLMAPAAARMEEALATATIAPPAVPLIANVSAAPVSDPETIRQLLVAQVTGMVRWRESVAFMAENGVSQCIEVGTGKVLAGLIRRIASEINVLSVETPADIEALVKAG